MSETFKEVGRPYDAILAEEFSLMLDRMWPGCPDQISIALAQLAEEIYAERKYG